MVKNKTVATCSNYLWQMAVAVSAALLLLLLLLISTSRTTSIYKLVNSNENDMTNDSRSVMCQDPAGAQTDMAGLQLASVEA